MRFLESMAKFKFTESERYECESGKYESKFCIQVLKMCT